VVEEIRFCMIHISNAFSVGGIDFGVVLHCKEFVKRDTGY